MERDLEEFASDPDAKAIFWNHTYNQAQMLDTAEEIQHAYATLEKQGCNETRLAIVNGYPILIQYASQGNNPSVDPLCLAFCFAVPGLALICKPQCWHCRAELKLKNLDTFRFATIQAVGNGRQSRMIRCFSPHRFEKGTTLLQSPDKRSIIYHINARNMAQGTNMVAPIFGVEIDNGIGSEGGQDSAVPARIPNRLMMHQCICGCICGTQHLNIEAFIQTARLEIAGL
jgi:hypothetical protein